MATNRLTNGDILPAIGDPAGYMFNARGTQHVIYRGYDSDIHELWWDSQGWHHTNATANAGVRGSTADPAGYMFDAQGTQHVIYRGPGREGPDHGDGTFPYHIHELWWDTQGWHHTDPTAVAGAPAAVGNPHGYMFDAQGTQHIVYRGTDNHIHELWWDTQGWHHTDLMPPPKAPTDLRVTDVADRKISVAWNDRSNDENGFTVQFRGKRAGSSDHTGSKNVGRNEVSTSLAGLRSNYEYTISVGAFNSLGRSQRSNEVRATTPARSISVSKEGVGVSAVFVVTGTGFTPNSLVVIRATAPNLSQRQFVHTAGGDGKFVARQSIPCLTGIELTFTAYEDSDTDGTFANEFITTCP
jgi:hypothetical protein